MLIAIPVFLIGWLAPKLRYAPIVGFAAAFLVETFRVNMIAGYREAVASLALNAAILALVYLAGCGASIWRRKRAAQQS